MVDSTLSLNKHITSNENCPSTLQTTYWKIVPDGLVLGWNFCIGNQLTGKELKTTPELLT